MDYNRRELAKTRAENFGKNLHEAYDIMFDFTLEDKFKDYNVEDFVKMERVLEIITDFYMMWEHGQIITVSQEREETQHGN